MKILHCCLANFYIDGYSYQENILPKYHKAFGHTVEILASTETYIDKVKLGYVQPSTYLTGDGIKITRIPYTSSLPAVLGRKLRVYDGVIAYLEGYRPDLIFVHGPQFVDAKKIISYVEKNPDTRLIVDSHADFGNSGKTWLSRNILHRIVYRYSTQLLATKAEVIYGVLPSRVKFLSEVYKVSPKKARLLEMGADVSRDQLAKREDRRSVIRQEMEIDENSFVLITGGRIEARKKIESLVEVVRQDKKGQLSLILFGKPVVEMEAAYAEWRKVKGVHLKGWIEPEMVYDLLFAADLAVFPGTHSVLWEQALGVGLPCVFRRWPDVDHVDLGGNCRFLETGTTAEVSSVVNELLNDEANYQAMKKVAMEKGIESFSYEHIASKAIEPVI